MKAGVMLIGLQPASQQQGELDLFSDAEAVQVESPTHTKERDRAALMEAIGDLNRRFGRDSVQIGSASLANGVNRGGEERSWSTKQERPSPRFTTRWDEMPVVKA